MKLCPFCGGMPHVAHTQDGSAKVVCGTCGASSDTHGAGECDAIMAWDWRVQDDSVPPIVKAMAAITRGEGVRS